VQAAAEIDSGKEFVFPFFRTIFRPFNSKISLFAWCNFSGFRTSSSACSATAYTLPAA
jgi:hypothetical protein